ncbi:MAG TPA: 16S rRNA (adenine(1518)-N(6)/adenine(1519)-N(6))-dimethyltransferase RsmA, partial [Chloroflexota bacterium]
DIVRAARVDATTDVLEVGPGLGVLTQLLASAARRVVAVEIDSHLADWLRSEFQASNVSVITTDILGVNPADYFDRPFTVVANLPYHISSPAVRHLLAAGPPFAQRLVVMLQAEVAERIAAAPGHLSALAVAVQAQARPTLVRHVAAKAFYPKPKVDSAVLVLEPIEETDRAVRRAELDRFVSLVQAGFKQPRKTLANSLADGLGTARALAAERLVRAGIDPSLRPQAVSMADWVRLFRDSTG